jgi:hypothetical protein
MGVADRFCDLSVREDNGSLVQKSTLKWVFKDKSHF